jgi:hypothetical protein
MSIDTHISCRSLKTKQILMFECPFFILNKPVKLLCSRNGICRPVSGSIYSLANPKSIIWIKCCLRVDERPMRKFSGLTLQIIKIIIEIFFFWTKKKSYSR